MKGRDNENKDKKAWFDKTAIKAKKREAAEILANPEMVEKRKHDELVRRVGHMRKVQDELNRVKASNVRQQKRDGIFNHLDKLKPPTALEEIDNLLKTVAWKKTSESVEKKSNLSETLDEALAELKIIEDQLESERSQKAQISKISIDKSSGKNDDSAIKDLDDLFIETRKKI